MLKITQLKLSLDQAYKEEISCLQKLAAKNLKINPDQINNLIITKKALDARKKSDIHFSYGVEVSLNLNEALVLKKLTGSNITLSQPKEYLAPQSTKELLYPPVVIGAGPAGLLAAITLAEAGLCPLILEQGEDVDSRQQKVDAFWQTGVLDPLSNVQFGEGGAGTFSDGKLTTNTKDIRNFKVLQEFVTAGAPKEILYLAKPHIGTDLLREVVKKMRQKIIALGGEVRFGHKLTNIFFANKPPQVAGVEITAAEKTYTLNTNHIILATGHSARDTFSLLQKLNVPLSPKPFSVGVRIEHLQKDINQNQYGKMANHPALGSADYKLACHLPNGRSVYTFCMCPGGSVVAATSQPKAIVTNGMSLHRRNNTNANSALLVGINPLDFPSEDPLAGIELQKQIEEKAFAVAGNTYHAPCQLVGDFLANRPSQSLGKVIPSYLPGISLGEVSGCFPSFITESLAMGLKEFSNKLPAFAHPEAVLTAPETRSSSPVRIDRNSFCQSITGLYPCGEGAGYAGGIISAATDGIRCAEAVLQAEN